MVVKKKLAENMKALRQILVHEVDGSVCNAGSVSPDGIGDMSDAYGVEMFAILRISWLFNEALGIQVVVVPCNKNVNVSHYLENVKAFLQRLPRQFDLRKGDPVLFHRQVPHFAIRFPIVQRYCSVIMERSVQVLNYSTPNVNLG